MQQWEYGYLYIVSLTGERPSPNPYADDKVAVVQDAKLGRILEGALNHLVALNVLGRAGWIISDATPGDGYNLASWLRLLLRAAEFKVSAPLSLYHEATHFMRRPVPEPG